MTYRRVGHGSGFQTEMPSAILIIGVIKNLVAQPSAVLSYGEQTVIFHGMMNPALRQDILFVKKIIHKLMSFTNILLNNSL